MAEDGVYLNAIILYQITSELRFAFLDQCLCLLGSQDYMVMWLGVKKVSVERYDFRYVITPNIVI